MILTVQTRLDPSNAGLASPTATLHAPCDLRALRSPLGPVTTRATSQPPRDNYGPQIVLVLGPTVGLNRRPAVPRSRALRRSALPQVGGFAAGRLRGGGVVDEVNEYGKMPWAEINA